MSVWLYEDGIGEERAIQISEGASVAARIRRKDDVFGVGTVFEGKLVKKLSSTTGLVEIGQGNVFFARRLTSHVTEGRTILFEIVRESLVETSVQMASDIWTRRKLAVCQPSSDCLKERAAPTLLQQLQAAGDEVRTVRAHQADELAENGWHDVIEAARSGIWEFAGGQLLVSPTPGMTVIDIDGDESGYALARAAAPEVARVIGLLDLGGSIGVDFPTLASRVERATVAERFDAAMTAPHERTAINGFGLLQVVKRRSRRSLMEICRSKPAHSAFLAVCREAERLGSPGRIRLCLSPDVFLLAQKKSDLIEELKARSGKSVAITCLDHLADHASFAQIVSS